MAQNDDRPLLPFMATALAFALVAGFVLAVLAPLAAAGTLPWQTRYLALVQAHGAVQLEGFAGLFVVGMGLRLAPRFAGVPQPPGFVAFSIFGLLVAGLAVRVVGHVLSGEVGDAALRAAAGLTVAGHTAFAATLIGVLCTGRQHRTDSWWWLILLGAIAWLAWGIIGAVGSWRAEGGAIPAAFGRAVTWLALLAGIGAFTWGVQAQTVPVFYGRKRPPLRRVAAPAGTAAVAAALTTSGVLDENDALAATGFVLWGIAITALTLLAGAVRGAPHRLRPRAQSMARFILAANRWAIAAAMLLALAGLRLATGTGPAGLEDAARHAFAIGFVTNLIIGIASLIAPMFAVERVVPGERRAEVHVAFPALQAAAAIRVAAALLAGDVSEDARQYALALAGALGWLAVAAFAYALIRAVRHAPKAKGIMIAMVETRERG